MKATAPWIDENLFRFSSGPVVVVRVKPGSWHKLDRPIILLFRDFYHVLIISASLLNRRNEKRDLHKPEGMERIARKETVYNDDPEFMGSTVPSKSMNR